MKEGGAAPDGRANTIDSEHYDFTGQNVVRTTQLERLQKGYLLGTSKFDITISFPIAI